MMKNPRGPLLWILLCIGFSVIWGSSYGPAQGALADFKAVYYAARCVLEHRDPYSPNELKQLYQTEDGSLPSNPVSADRFISGVFVCINLPTTLFLAAPLALLGWGVAHLLWVSLMGGLLALASVQIWSAGRVHAPGFTLLAVCFMAANAEILVAGGNSAGIVVSLCVIGAWCLVGEQFITVGIVCLVLALAIKPHDAGFVWLYFLLAGGIHRKRALRILVITALLAVPAVLWVSHVSPYWAQELHANLQAGFAPGGNNAPGPRAISVSNANLVISLQSALAILTDNPAIYNAASYLICGSMLLVWALHACRLRNSRVNLWLGLAAAAAPTLLITYHRGYDSKLLLLTVPATAILWAKRGWIGWIALLCNSASILFTADIPLVLLLMVRTHFSISANGWMGKALQIVVLETTPVILLIAGVFNLWAYLKFGRDLNARESCGEMTGEPLGVPIPEGCSR